MKSCGFNRLKEKEHVIVKPMSVRDSNDKLILPLPTYGWWDGNRGLTFAIDDWYGNKIEIASFEMNNGTYSGTLKFTFYDHFGLDTPDMNRNLNPLSIPPLYPSSFEGFRQWYILQHWEGLGASVQPKPFVTVVSFTVQFSGTY